MKMLSCFQSIQRFNKSKNLKSKIFMMIWITNWQNQLNSRSKNQSKRDQMNLKKTLNNQKWERISRLNKPKRTGVQIASSKSQKILKKVMMIL